jgi:N-acetyl-alpha-D-muramate 1-phosphate uridylyltransferase
VKALVFAAGRGERMRPLTDHSPKPLLEAGGKPLIAWHLEKLAGCGVRDVVINTSWLAGHFEAALGSGERFGLRIHYRYEGPTPLETGGGMLSALDLLGRDPFLVVSGDIWTDADFRDLPRRPNGLAHLLMVDNPPHHADGDFSLQPGGLLRAQGEPRLTYAGVGVYDPGLLDGWQDVVDADLRPGAAAAFRLAPLLVHAMSRGLVSGQRHRGLWTDVGTPERLQALREQLG